MPAACDRLAQSPDTARRLRDLFAGRSCAACGSPAGRLVGGQFLCHAHYLRGHSREAFTPRVYRCAAPTLG
jgi:hypothetical protein